MRHAAWPWKNGRGQNQFAARISSGYRAGISDRELSWLTGFMLKARRSAVRLT
jgi:hypothetical protein